MTTPPDTGGLSNWIYAILMAAYIALDRFSVWKASRERQETKEKLETVHTLVNGRSEAANAKIAELTAQVAELKQEKATLIAAFAGRTGELKNDQTKP